MELSCEKVREITLMYVDCVDEIPDENAKKAYLLHLENCEECRCFRDEILSDINAVHSLGDESPTKNGVTLTESVMQNLRASEKKSHGRFKFRFVGTAAAAVIILVMYLGSNSPVFQNIIFGEKSMSDSVPMEDTEQKSTRSLDGGELIAYASHTDEGVEEAESIASNEELPRITSNDVLPEIASNDELPEIASGVSLDKASKSNSSDNGTEATDAMPNEEEKMFALTAPTAESGENGENEFAAYVDAQNSRVSLCVVHPEGYHIIPFEYAEKIGFTAFKEWVEGITNEEVEYTPEYFENNFKDNFN